MNMLRNKSSLLQLLTAVSIMSGGMGDAPSARAARQAFRFDGRELSAIESDIDTMDSESKARLLYRLRVTLADAERSGMPERVQRVQALIAKCVPTDK